MNRILLPVLVAGAMVLTASCATKSYVKQQTAPLIDKVDQLDDQTAQTTRGIHDLDQRSQQGIQGVDARAAAADQKAVAAGQQAGEAQQLASTVNHGVDELSNRVVNLDNYRRVTEASVHFAFDKADLTAKDKEELDKMGQQIPNIKGYIVQIEGRTDWVGNPDYNVELSQRRAAAVTQYLVSKYDVPAHKVYVIGLGKYAPVENNTTARGRAENRRVDVRLLSNELEARQNAAAEPETETGPAETPGAIANPPR